MKKYQEFIFFVLLLTFGFFYRMFLTSHSDTELISDMYRYHEMTLSMLSGTWTADCCEKNAGYPAYLTYIYHFFGPYNDMALRINQIVLDLLAALLIFIAAKNIVNKNIGYITFILYITNPFTGAFAGLRSPENLTFFIIALTCFLITLSQFKTNKILWFTFGFLLGLLLFVRVQFQFFTVFLILCTGLLCIGKKLKLIFFFLAVSGFLIANSYSFIANYINFQKITPVLPYSMTWEALYFNFYQQSRWPEIFAENNNGFNDVTAAIYKNYYNTPLSERPSLENQYKVIFFKRLKTDWPAFLKAVLKNFFWGWDKYHISELVDPFYPADTLPLRIYNILLLSFTLLGLLKYYFRKKFQAFKNPIFLFTVILFTYISGVFSIIDNETRHRLPFYVPAMIWAAYGLDFMYRSTYPKLKRV
jgi:4-amino-4-deoxy-L-arabinose transferase-like glycosyltransferase